MKNAIGLLVAPNKLEWFNKYMESVVIAFLTIGGVVILVYAIGKQAQFYSVHNTKSVSLCGEKSQVPCGSKLNLGDD